MIESKLTKNNIPNQFQIASLFGFQVYMIKNLYEGEQLDYRYLKHSKYLKLLHEKGNL